MHEKPAPYYLIYEEIQEFYNVPTMLVRIATPQALDLKSIAIPHNLSHQD